MHRPDPTRYAFGVQAPVRRGRLGLVLSALAHLGLVALLLVQLRHDFARVLDPGRLDGRRSGGGGGGGGASRETYISLPAPAATPRAEVAVTPPPERTPPPVPVVPTPTPEPVVVPPPPPAADPVAPAPVPVAATTPSASAQSGTAGPGSGPGQGGGAGGGIGGGIGPGVGTGSGPGTGDSGSAVRGRPPTPKRQVIPSVDNVPKEYRGVEIRVTLAVSATGIVERVSFNPEIRDGKFRRQLRETMLAYRFAPALGPDGAPIASTYEQTLTF